jgi:hypothetical protein
MRSKKRARVKRTLEIMRENEVKYTDLVLWMEADKEALLEDEDYVTLKQLQNIEEKYKKDIAYIGDTDSWGFGFLFGMLACTKSYKSILENNPFELSRFTYLDVAPKTDYSDLKRVNRIKEAVNLMDAHDTKYFDLVHYSRCSPNDYEGVRRKELMDYVRQTQNKYDREIFELSSQGKNSQRQHGFHSGILAGCRYYREMILESVEQAIEDFPFLDT